MANTIQDFELVFLSDADVSVGHPSWSRQAIEDYQAIKRNLALVSDIGDENTEQAETIVSGLGAVLQSQLNGINERLGSGNPLTSDETGFTVDLDTLSVDMTEA
jgi:hypothetical protein